MYPVIFKIYGPFAINSYGLMLAIGLLVTAWLITKDKHSKKLIAKNELFSFVSLSTLVGLIGGRLLYILGDSTHKMSVLEMLSVWDGGFSMLGAILLVVPFLVAYMRFKKIKILSVLDLAGIYVLLIEMFARIGCFLAGCCYGTPTNLPWAVTYKNTACVAPSGIPLHPTQLYTALLCLLGFFAIKKISWKPTKLGQIFLFYLTFTSFIRFFVDFFRGDRTMLELGPEWLQIFSLHQWIALIIGTCSLLIIFFRFNPEKKKI